MTTSANSVRVDDLSNYLNALKDYKKTGYKQTRSIIDALKKSDLTSEQLLEIEPGAWIRFVDKIEPENDEEKEFKESVHELMEGYYKKFKASKGASPSKMGGKSQILLEEREDKENASMNTQEQMAGRVKGSEHRKEGISEQEENRITEPKESEINKHHDSEHPPKVVVDFIVKSLAQGLLMDYKDDPKAKKEAQELANERATEMERAINEETKNDPEAYRMEARNVANFLTTKHNHDLRKGLLDGVIDCKKFVQNKEEFLNDHAKGVMQENEKRHYHDVTDFDRKLIRESSLHKCENCGSSRINFVEKLISAAQDQSSLSVLFCADCEHIELK